MLRLVMAAAIASGLVAAGPAQSDVLGRLGMTAAAAEDRIFLSLASGVPALGTDAAQLVVLPPAERAAMVRAVFTLARTLTGSEPFARRYALYRQAQLPPRPAAPADGDDARAAQQSAIDLAIRQALAGADELPPEARRQLDENIAEMRRQVAELNADPAYRAGVDDAAAAAAADADAEHARRLRMFEQEWPADLDTLVARRLQQFLAVCDAVDFDAALETGADGIRRFVNPAYERRSADWKRCYRAGPLAVAAARTAATEWLTTLRREHGQVSR